MSATPTREVVAVILSWHGRIGLFERSSAIQHDAGAWHCSTGYLDDSNGPIQQADHELWEETGLSVDDLEHLAAGPEVQLADSRGGQTWTVHTFVASTNRYELTLNWEYDRYHWVQPVPIPRFRRNVSWLADILQATMPGSVSAKRLLDATPRRAQLSW